MSNFPADDKDAKKTARVVLHMVASVSQYISKVPKTDYRKVLELHPDDGWAKQQIDSLSKAE